MCLKQEKLDLHTATKHMCKILGIVELDSDIRKMLAKTDFTKISKRMVRKELESRYKQDLWHLKEDIADLCSEIVDQALSGPSPLHGYWGDDAEVIESAKKQALATEDEGEDIFGEIHPPNLMDMFPYSEYSERLLSNPEQVAEGGEVGNGSEQVAQEEGVENNKSKLKSTQSKTGVRFSLAVYLLYNCYMLYNVLHRFLSVGIFPGK